jgi:hypothetical protein
MRVHRETSIVASWFASTIGANTSTQRQQVSDCLIQLLAIVLELQ